MDIRQSDEYAKFMESIGWKVKRVDGANAFIKRFPLIGSFVKIQRPETIPSVLEIESLRKQEKAFKIVVEPTIVIPAKAGIHNNLYGSQIKSGMTRNNWLDLANNGFKPTNPYAPSKTIQIDLTKSFNEVFKSLSKATRWAIRKAEKNGIMIKEGSIDEFIKLKTKGFLFLQNSFSDQIRKLFKAFSPNKVKVFISYLRRSHLVQGETLTKIVPVAGVFLLLHDRTAYYWMATATKEGKELAAPSLLVWETIKLAKEKECTIFDFEGVFDERFPKQTSSWKGFTKFKEGFGGKEVYFPRALEKFILPFFHQN